MPPIRKSCVVGSDVVCFIDKERIDEMFPTNWTSSFHDGLAVRFTAIVLCTVDPSTLIST
jgi:hypothetical protein